jgi:hypothetical protein
MGKNALSEGGRGKKYKKKVTNDKREDRLSAG